MTELAIVLLFTGAGMIAALLALQLAEDSRLIRRLVWAFCLLALANLVMHGWRVVARDPEGAARMAAIAAVLFLGFWAYRRLLRAIRHAAERREAGRRGTGRDGP